VKAPFAVVTVRCCISTLCVNEIRQIARETELVVCLECREQEQEGRAFMPGARCPSLSTLTQYHIKSLPLQHFQCMEDLRFSRR
jgi:hypothetical protein